MNLESRIPSCLLGVALAACAGPAPAPIARAPVVISGADAPADRYKPRAVPTAQDDLRSRDRGEPQGSWGERTQFDLFWVPGYFATVETEQNGVEVRPDLDPGMGLGLRAAAGNANQSAGLLYLGGWFDAEQSASDLEMHSLYFDFETRARIAEAGGRFLFTAGGGIGVTWSEFDQGFEDEVGGAALLRMTLDYELSAGVAFEAGLGGYIMGYPGDTQGWGSFLILGGRVSF